MCAGDEFESDKYLIIIDNELSASTAPIKPVDRGQVSERPSAPPTISNKLSVRSRKVRAACHPSLVLFHILVACFLLATAHYDDIAV